MIQTKIYRPVQALLRSSTHLVKIWRKLVLKSLIPPLWKL